MITVMCNKDTAIMTPNAPKQRRTNKPLMERKRRERINKCLNELKTLVLKAQKKDLSRFAKLEKADILEMTLRHLRSFQDEEMLPRSRLDVSRYRSGFTRCVSEVTAYLQGKVNLAPNLAERLIAHLNNILPQISSPSLGDSSAAPQWGDKQDSFSERRLVVLPQQGQQTVARIDNRNGCYTISKTISGPSEIKTMDPSSCMVARGGAPETHSVIETSPGREASPPWSPPSPPLTDSIQLRLSLHKIEPQFLKREATPPQFIMRPVSLLVSRTPNATTIQTGATLPLNMASTHHAPNGCQEAPLNLATSHRGNSGSQFQELDSHLETSPVANSYPPVFLGSQPTDLEGENLIFQGSPRPLSPPSSVSSTPEPPPAQVSFGSASSVVVGGGSRALKSQRPASPTLDQPKTHWRPW